MRNSGFHQMAIETIEKEILSSKVRWVWPEMMYIHIHHVYLIFRCLRSYAFIFFYMFPVYLVLRQWAMGLVSMLRPWVRSKQTICQNHSIQKNKTMYILIYTYVYTHIYIEVIRCLGKLWQKWAGSKHFISRRPSSQQTNKHMFLNRVSHILNILLVC